MGHIHEEHRHEHGGAHVHAHGDGHVHTHTHNYDEAHTHPDTSVNLKEKKALLSYMIHHNEHHAEELASLLDSLPQKAQKKLLIAIGSFEAANVELQEVLDCLE